MKPAYYIILAEDYSLSELFEAGPIRHFGEITGMCRTIAAFHVHHSYHQRLAKVNLTYWIDALINPLSLPTLFSARSSTAKVSIWWNKIQYI